MNEPNDKTDDDNPERKSEEQTDKQPAKMSGSRGARRAGRRAGRRPAKVDAKAKLERSRQSARECRARKKMRYQYLEELMANREQAIFSLREELETHKQWCIQMDTGQCPADLLQFVERVKSREKNKTTMTIPNTRQKPSATSGPTCHLQQSSDSESRGKITLQENQPSPSTSSTAEQSYVYTATVNELPTFLDEL